MDDTPPLDELVNALNASGLNRRRSTPRFEDWLETLRERGGSDLLLVAGDPSRRTRRAARGRVS